MTGGETYSGSWSSDRRIAYTEWGGNICCSPSWIGVVASTMPNTGSRITQSGEDRDPDWSPDNAKIVFTSSRDGNGELYVMNPDGTAQTRLTTTPDAHEQTPTWSPDAAEIAYERGGHIWKMNANGTGQTDLGVAGFEPAWQPVAATGYPRPAGATPVRVPLVPSFESCTNPNRTHGTPLAHPSCAPPDVRASYLTFGRPEGETAQSVGQVRISVLPGDVGVRVSLTDVRRASDLADAPGWVDVVIPVRITDRLNGNFGSTPATVQDTSFNVSVPCTATADPSIGSTCAINTTANTIWPQLGLPVRQGKRTVWEFGQIAVWDGGEDRRMETYDDNTVLAVQGIFVP
jgi:hypothetical protein